MAPQLFLGIPVLTGLVHILRKGGRGLSRPGGGSALLRSRLFQAGVKYWFCLALVLALILGLSASEHVVNDELRHYRPLFGFVAACLVMSEKVG